MAMSKRTVTTKDKIFTLMGPEIKVGQKAPNFTLTAIDFSEISLSQSKGKATCPQ